MATHSSIVACEIPWTEEPGGLHSMGSQIVSRTRLSTNKLGNGIASKEASKGEFQPVSLDEYETLKYSRKTPAIPSK